jgi:signal transduction histidine kinase
MKNNIYRYFCMFIIFSICLAIFYTCNLNNLFVSSIGNKITGKKAVDINDTIKNSEVFLKDKNYEKLRNSVNGDGFDLKLYTLNGRIIFDSKNMNYVDERNNGVKKNKIYDINKILVSANANRQIYVVNTTNVNNDYTALKKDSAIAIAVVNCHENTFGFNRAKGNVIKISWLFFLTFLLFAVFLFTYIYMYVLRPFKKLENFAGGVASGNLDFPLVYERKNIFGAFSWAFDMLRNELKAAREREAEAQQTKKELVAVLSHDIRTPIASIRAYSECLKSLPDKNSDRSNRYIDVIINKADEIAKLSQDMFMHAISDLEKLEISPDKYQSRELLNSIIEPLILHYENTIIIENQFPEVSIFTDKARLAQVFENIISNSVKYANNSNIEITSSIEGEMLKCCFKDFGQGVENEDIPFLFDKFFRGKNAKKSEKPGSGLGLYISKYILEKTEGKINAHNYSENGKSGFCVEVFIKIK